MEPEREVVRRVLDVHRAHLLEQARSVHVSFSSGGLAFRAKGQPTALLEAEAVLVPGRQEISVRGRHPSPWGVAIRDSHELKRRLDALHTGWRLLRWTPEDVGVFAAGALWTYVMLPLLLRDARHVRVRRSDAQGDEVVLQLDEGVAGHAPHHVVRVDPAGRIVRHDYTATAFGRWARAAQTIEGHQAGATVPFGTDRRVTPRLGRRRLPGPTLVWIHVWDIALDQGPAPVAIDKGSVSSTLPFVTTYETVLDALADGTRRRILEQLVRGPAPVSKIAEQLPVSRPAVSQHLRVLLDARLVEFDQSGTRNVYRLERAGFGTLRTWLDSFWEDALGAFEAYANRPDKRGDT